MSTVCEGIMRYALWRVLEIVPAHLQGNAMNLNTINAEIKAGRITCEVLDVSAPVEEDPTARVVAIQIKRDGVALGEPLSVEYDCSRAPHVYNRYICDAVDCDAVIAEVCERLGFEMTSDDEGDDSIYTLFIDPAVQPHLPVESEVYAD